MKLDERGKQYPRPVIDTKKALESCNPGEAVKVLVDNEIAAQNLSRMATSKGPSTASEKISDSELFVKVAVGQGVTSASGAADDLDEEPVTCQPDSRKKGMIVAPPSNFMGYGDPELEEALMKGLVYTLTQQDALSETIPLYNSGAYFFCRGSDNLEDLKSLESQGVGILTCGICLSFYGLSEKLQVGSVTNMYGVMERMVASKFLVCPQAS